MCGIVGYVGPREAADLSDRRPAPAGISRLRQLGRGHDRRRGQSDRDQAAGRIDHLVASAGRSAVAGHVGIGHTRWATHGAADRRQRPSALRRRRRRGVVHNGVIENYRAAQGAAEGEGYQFRSATDTEVIAHLIASCLDKAAGSTPTADAHESRRPATRRWSRRCSGALAQLHGTYGLAMLFRDYPDVIIAARLGSPLVVGVGDGEHFVASDASPLAGYTDKIVYLADHELAVVTADSLRGHPPRPGRRSRTTCRCSTSQADDVDLGGYPHYMLKEIFEQPESLRNAMRGRLEPATKPRPCSAA